MNQIAGLPTHPLLVHIPVVLIPLLALAVVAFALRPVWRPGLSAPIAAIAVVTLVATLLAASTGGWLRERVNDTTLVRTHAQQGDQLRAIAAVFCLAALGLVILAFVGRRSPIGFRIPLYRQLLALACVGTIFLAVVATVWDVRAGHSGARAVWSETQHAMVNPERQQPGNLSGTPGAAAS